MEGLMGHCWEGGFGIESRLDSKERESSHWPVEMIGLGLFPHGLCALASINACGVGCNSLFLTQIYFDNSCF